MLVNFFLILLTCVWVLLNNPCQAGLCWNKLGRVLLNLMAVLIGHSNLFINLKCFCFLILNKTVSCLTGIL